MSFQSLTWRTDGLRVTGTKPGHASIRIAVDAPGLPVAERRALAVYLADALNQHDQGLTVRDLAVHAALRTYIAKHGIAPSRQELAAPLGVTRPTVDASLERLQAAGLIQREPNKARALTIVDPVVDPTADPAAGHVAEGAAS